MIQRRDWALLVIAAAKGESLQPVQLQKSLFLLGENLKPTEHGLAEQFYAFKPYDYGPFDSSVYVDAQLLAKAGLVSISRREGHSYREYTITPAGIERAREIELRLSQPVAQHIREVVAWTRSLSFSDLVRSIYQRFPEQRARSVFRD